MNPTHKGTSMRSFFILLVMVASIGCTDLPDEPSASSYSQAISYANWLIAPGGAADGVNYGLIVDNQASDGTLNYGIQIRNTSPAPGQHFGMHINTNGPNAVNYGILVGASGGAQNIAIRSNA